MPVRYTIGLVVGLLIISHTTGIHDCLGLHIVEVHREEARSTLEEFLHHVPVKQILKFCA